MLQAQSLQWRLELIWWMATALVVALVLLPVYTQLPDYPFLWVNVLFIVALVTFTRHIFLLRHTFLAPRQYLKLILLFACVPLVFLMVQEINLFQVYLDENGPESIVGTLPRAQQIPLMQYIRSQFLLFGVGSVIGAVVFALRLVLSIWRRYNGLPD